MLNTYLLINLDRHPVDRVLDNGATGLIIAFHAFRKIVILNRLSFKVGDRDVVPTQFIADFSMLVLVLLILVMMFVYFCLDWSCFPLDAVTANEQEDDGQKYDECGVFHFHLTRTFKA